MDEDNTPDLKEQAEFMAEQELKAAVVKMATLDYSVEQIIELVRHHHFRRFSMNPSPLWFDTGEESAKAHSVESGRPVIFVTDGAVGYWRELGRDLGGNESPLAALKDFIMGYEGEFEWQGVKVFEGEEITSDFTYRQDSALARSMFPDADGGDADGR